MSRRIEIELTSVRGDGIWTWRAAGARQPKGLVNASVLYDGAKVGDVMRAEADFDIDGISILSVMPPKEKAPEPERLEVIGSGQDPGPGVITSLVGRAGGRGRSREDRPWSDGPSGRDERRGPRPEGRGPRPDGATGPRDRGGPRPERGPRPDLGTGPPDRSGPRPERRPRPERTGGPGEPMGQADGPRRERRPSDAGSRGPGRPADLGRTRGEPGGPRSTGSERPRRDAGPSRPAPKRLVPGTTHRDAVLATVAPEHHPIAQHVLRGGMPAVRQAIAADNEQAKVDGRPATSSEPILAIAEDLLPRLKTAEWRDRAEAASAMGDEVSIRDLRSVVAGAEAAARDEETRRLASTLREALHRRVEAHRASWLGEIGTALEEVKVMRALRLTARPPDPSVKLPAELAVRLAEAAGAAMAPDAPAERWAALLEAVVGSPVRRTVKPAGLPVGAPPELLDAARHAAGQVPALAPLLGLSMPPAPGPARTLRSLTSRPGGPRPRREPGRPVPPAPRPAPPQLPRAEASVAPGPVDVTSSEIPDAATEPATDVASSEVIAAVAEPAPPPSLFPSPAAPGETGSTPEVTRAATPPAPAEAAAEPAADDQPEPFMSAHEVPPEPDSEEERTEAG